MPYSTYRPELMGTAVLTPSGAFEAGSMQSFTLVYTAGTFGVDDTGSIKIGFRFATDFGPVQFSNPSAAGYTTAEASNGAALELKWEFKRNIRPWSRSLYIGVIKEFLAPGDTITIRFGDRRQGSPGIRVQTYCETGFEFRVFADPIATYDYVALPESPKISIVPGSGVTWHAVLPTEVRAGEPFRLAVKATDRWGNPSRLEQQNLKLEWSPRRTDLPATISVHKGAFAATLTSLTQVNEGTIDVRVVDEGGTSLCTSNPLKIVSTRAEKVHFWGDTHGQSDETLGTNSAREYFEFGRDRAFLDVMGHQGNDFQITGAFWQDLNAISRELDVPGKFVCIPGYEWSANTAVGGDRNVHYRHEGETIHRSSHAQIADSTDIADEQTDAHTAHELFKKLAGKDCVVMAHVGGRYADVTFAHDHKLETAVEVHSAWGTFEWIITDALKSGYRVGVVANSDGHKGRPGACYPGASFFGSYGGLTCFIANRLDRDSIFECMRRRHHYGTTGNRLWLNVGVTTVSDAEVFLRDPAVTSSGSISARQAIMGDILRVKDEDVELVIAARGSAPIERVDIFDGMDLIETFRPYSADDLGDRVRLVYTGAEYRGRARTTTWDGRLQLSGSRHSGATMFNNWNLDRGIQHQTDIACDWKAVTTGNYGGIDLANVGRAGTLSFETKPAAGKIDLANLGVDPIIFDAGGLDRRVELQRLPDNLTKQDVELRRRIKLRAKGDTRTFCSRTANRWPPRLVEPNLHLPVIRDLQAQSRLRIVTRPSRGSIRS